MGVSEPAKTRFLILWNVAWLSVLFCIIESAACEDIEQYRPLMSIYATQLISKQCKVSNSEAIIHYDPLPTLERDGAILSYTLLFDLVWPKKKRTFEGVLRYNIRTKARTWETVSVTDPPGIHLKAIPE